MKGLAALFAGKPPMGGAPDEESSEAAPDSEAGGSSAKKFARVAAEALADQDIDAAADALESLARAVATG